MTTKIAVITGANGGLGLASAKALAAAGALVVMAARNQEKAAAARDEILALIAPWQAKQPARGGSGASTADSRR